MTCALQTLQLVAKWGYHASVLLPILAPNPVFQVHGRDLIKTLLNVE